MDISKTFRYIFYFVGLHVTDHVPVYSVGTDMVNFGLCLLYIILTKMF